MLKKLLLALFLMLPTLLAAQGNVVMTHGTGAPSGACAFVRQYIDDSSGDFYICWLGTWTLSGGGSGITGSLTSGYFPYASGAHAISNSNAFYDSGTSRVAIGNITPTALFSVGTVGGFTVDASGNATLNNRTGNGASYWTATGSLTAGHGVVIDGSNNLVDAGAATGSLTSVTINGLAGMNTFAVTGTATDPIYTQTKTTDLDLSAGGANYGKIKLPVAASPSFTCQGCLQYGTTQKRFYQDTNEAGTMGYLLTSVDVSAAATGAGFLGQAASVGGAPPVLTARTLTGTANEITVTAGDFSATPTLSLPAALTFTGKTVTGGTITGQVSVSSALYKTTTNCADAAGAAACGAAPAGAFVIDAGATTVVVSTTAVTANSRIIITEAPYLATELSITCNTALLRTYAVTALTAATSFTITTSATPVTNPACLTYLVIN